MLLSPPGLLAPSFSASACSSARRSPAHPMSPAHHSDRPRATPSPPRTTSASGSSGAREWFVWPRLHRTLTIISPAKSPQPPASQGLQTPVVRSKRTPIACTECRRRQVKVSTRSVTLFRRSGLDRRLVLFLLDSVLAVRHSANAVKNAASSASTSLAASKRRHRAAPPRRPARRRRTLYPSQCRHTSTATPHVAHRHRGSRLTLLTKTTFPRYQIHTRGATIGKGKPMTYPHPTCRFHSSSLAELRLNRGPRVRRTVGKTTISRPTATKPMVRAHRCSRRSLLTKGTRLVLFPMVMQHRMRTRGQLTPRYHTAMVEAMEAMEERHSRRICLPSEREYACVGCGQRLLMFPRL